MLLRAPLALVLLLGCSAARSEQPAAQPAPPAAAPVRTGVVEEALRYDSADPLRDLEGADVLDRAARGAGRPPATAAPRTCRLVSEARRVWPSPAVAQLAAQTDGFVVTGYATSGGNERVFVLHVPARGLPEPVASFEVSPPHPTPRFSPPGLGVQASAKVAVAFSDGAGVLWLAQLRVGGAHGAGAPVTLARGVDTRFAPAVAFGKRGPLVAFTLGTTPMRTQLTRIGPDGALLGTHDLTPEAMGAAAPAFVRGATPLTLVMADARNGMSPITRVVLDDDGAPGKPEVAVPVGMMSQPPELAAAAAPFGTFVSYTGLGSAATSAVGLVQIAPAPGAPHALVKGIAYGPLHIAADTLGDALAFAATAPLAAGKAPNHDIVVARVDARGVGPALHLAGSGGDVARVALASTRDGELGATRDGELGVLFGDAQGLHLAVVRCQP